MEGKKIVVKKQPLGRRLRKYWPFYVMLLPAILYIAIFKYWPMYGVQIAFKNYKMSLGVMGSKWVGVKHFKDFFESYYFWTLMKNTAILSIYSLVVGFPIPIIIALIVNELKGGWKRTVQTIIYAPHFISTVVLVGMIVTMFSPSMGVVNTIIEKLGGERIYFMGKPQYFRHLFIWSGVWQGSGWSAITYLAALSAVNPELHESASIDGASRMQRILHINLPCILPTIIIMLILRMGQILSVGYEKAYLLQTDMNLDVSEIISTYVYKRGLINNSYSFSTAVGMFNSVINISMLLITNQITKKVTETSLF